MSMAATTNQTSTEDLDFEANGGDDAILELVRSGWRVLMFSEPFDWWLRTTLIFLKVSRYSEITCRALYMWLTKLGTNANVGQFTSGSSIQNPLMSKISRVK